MQISKHKYVNYFENGILKGNNLIEIKLREQKPNGEINTQKVIYSKPHSAVVFPYSFNNIPFCTLNTHRTSCLLTEFEVRSLGLLVVLSMKAHDDLVLRVKIGIENIIANMSAENCSQSEENKIFEKKPLRNFKDTPFLMFSAKSFLVSHFFVCFFF